MDMKHVYDNPVKLLKATGSIIRNKRKLDGIMMDNNIDNSSNNNDNDNHNNVVD
jgi:hypothetical protein